MRGRRIGQEVAQRNHRGEQRRRQRERGELNRADVTDDRRVGEQVQRFCGERPERGQGKAQDLAVVRRATEQEADSTIRS
jgi:hypothetical protein